MTVEQTRTAVSPSAWGRATRYSIKWKMRLRTGREWRDGLSRHEKTRDLVFSAAMRQGEMATVTQRRNRAWGELLKVLLVLSRGWDFDEPYAMDSRFRVLTKAAVVTGFKRYVSVWTLCRAVTYRDDLSAMMRRNSPSHCQIGLMLRCWVARRHILGFAHPSSFMLSPI